VCRCCSVKKSTPKGTQKRAQNVPFWVLDRSEGSDLTLLERMAGTTRLELATSAVTACLTRAAEPPADQFGTLALPAHSQRESRRLGGRHRPAPEFPDHWAGSRTETI